MAVAVSGRHAQAGPVVHHVPGLNSGEGVPLNRRTRRLPRILTPQGVDQLNGASRTHRDRAGRGDGVRCPAPLRDPRATNGGPQASRNKSLHRRGQGRTSTPRPDLGALLRPLWRPLPSGRTASGRVHRPGVRGPQAAHPPSRGVVECDGPNEVLRRRQAPVPGWTHATCHEPSHTCLTRLRKAGSPFFVGESAVRDHPRDPFDPSRPAVAGGTSGLPCLPFTDSPIATQQVEQILGGAEGVVKLCVVHP